MQLRNLELEWLEMDTKLRSLDRTDISPLDQNFHLFSHLPVELRHRIWIFAHPHPRKVEGTPPLFQRKESHHPPPLELRSGFAHLLVNYEAVLSS
jgi:hypothetical protein